MAYFRDLTFYKYLSSNPRVKQINIGWLDICHKFTHGVIDPIVIDILEKLASHPKNLTMGWHDCPFCKTTITIDPATGVSKLISDRIGNGEIHIPGVNITYIAPILIIHYIKAHNYKPPQEFIDAVMHHWNTKKMRFSKSGGLHG